MSTFRATDASAHSGIHRAFWRPSTQALEPAPSNPSGFETAVSRSLSTWTSFLLAFTALLPLINPIGSALIFLGLVGDEPAQVYHSLARRIAMATFFFLVVIEFLGSLLLSFFGISLPIIQLTGGLVIVATAWTLLFDKDSSSHARGKHQEIGDSAPASGRRGSRRRKSFTPFTFPLTAGPGKPRR